MYPNENVNQNHHGPKPINNNQTKNYISCMKRKRNTSVIFFS